MRSINTDASGDTEGSHGASVGLVDQARISSANHWSVDSHCEENGKDQREASPATRSKAILV